MKRIFIPIISLAMLSMTFSGCKEKSKPDQNVAEQEQSSEHVMDAQDSLEMLRLMRTGGMEFFGERLSGKNINDIIKKMEKTGMVSLHNKNVLSEDSSYYKVDFCNVPCGMNFIADRMPDGKLYMLKLNFMTSRQDIPTYRTFVKGISQKYGKPEESEDEYEADDIWRTYTWGLSEIKVRHVRSEKGGIVVFWNK